MKKFVNSTVAGVLLFATSMTCFADVQYTETSKVTGGAMAGAMKFAGVFSKDAKQVTQGTTSTISLKGNKMRRESSLGQAEIIDLDKRQITHLDLKNKTYSTMTFDEMKAQLEEARKKAAEQQAKQHKEKQADVKLTPKISITPGTETKKVLDYTAKEVKTRIEMEMQSTDPKTQGQTATMWLTSDAYVAPVKGEDELKHFYMRMAKELDWVPGAVFGGNPQMSPAIVEYNKSAATAKGMPLLTYMSMGMGAVGAAGAPQPASQATPEKKESSGNVVSKGLGGMLSMGRKKKKDDSEQEGKEGSAPAGATGSLMDTTIEVTSFSTSAVDSSLFTVPADFKQVQPKKGEVQ
ncbi:MAG TPA: hypothetical protein VF532_17545 [Candidatus Angelobacter sp.]